MQARPVKAPSPREVGDWQSAEANAVEWLKWLGYPDARPTKGGPDGGIDTIATGAFAQVKWYGKAVGRAPLQQLFGARAGRPGMLFFFTNAGYSAPALRYADSVDIAAFTYSTSTGLILPVNGVARRVFAEAQTRHEAPPPQPHPPSKAEAPIEGTILAPGEGPASITESRPRAVGCLVAVVCFAVTVLLVIFDNVVLHGASPPWVAIPGTLSCLLGVVAVVAAVARARGE